MLILSAVVGSILQWRNVANNAKEITKLNNIG